MDSDGTKKMSFVAKKGDAWELDSVIHFMGGDAEDRANVERANRKARRWARIERWRARLRC